MAEAGYFASRCKARGSIIQDVFSCRRRAAENSRAQPLPARAACRLIALEKAVGATEFDKVLPFG
jgi:hypothetical protein